jgi:hypothetical protein
VAIPSLVNGVLPPGTYSATLAEVTQAFDQVGSTTRAVLDLALQHAVALIWARDPTAVIFVGGSYVTAAIDPGDVDLAVRSDIWRDVLFTAEFTAAYPADALLVEVFINAKQSAQHMEDFFREIQASTTLKGIIQVLP